MRFLLLFRVALLGGMFLLSSPTALRAQPRTSGVASPNFLADESVQVFLSDYCVDCHNSDDPAAGVDLEAIQEIDLLAGNRVWESVVRKLRARQMPPEDGARPDEPEYVEVLTSLESSLDELADAHPRPGRTATFRRLTRFEYQNSIRDLLDLEIDATTMLPADEVSHGFDNVTVGDLSPTLLNRYVTASQAISRLAIGKPSNAPGGTTIRVKADRTQEEHVEGLPFGTRGGVLIRHTFPRDGEYEVRIRLTRDRNEHVEGLQGSHKLELLLDRDRMEVFTIKPPSNRAPANAEGWEKPTHEHVDRHLVARFHVTAGPHELGATFLKNPSSLLETKRQPLNVAYNMYRHPRRGPAVFQVSINGPFESSGIAETPSRKKVFGRWLSDLANSTDDKTDQQVNEQRDEQRAREILSRLMRRACRQPISDGDLVRPMELYREGRANGGFEDGIELALSGILIHPKFLFRIEQDPADIESKTGYVVSDVELATRLSFFLWSSIPDEELLDLAEQGRLQDPEVLEQQTRRMLADERSQALLTNFVGQWLYLRNLESITPDGRKYPDFDDNLRRAFQRETELFCESIFREDRSVLELIQSDFTFLNERLAKHYGIPHVFGSRFRRVELAPETQRGGLLRHGSILTVTSYATRTSPVIRGKWILENLIGTPPPPPPPNVPALEDNHVSAKLPVRERLAQHRADPACASCHNLIDPAGFALENFDAVGRWRDTEGGRQVDAMGGLPDGRIFAGVDGLEQGLVDRPEPFVGTLTEKLLTYALGRGLESYDGPAVRSIVREASRDDYRFSSLILGVVKSQPFQMRTSR